MLHIQKPQQDITVQLEQGKILPLVFRLTIPAVIAQLITFLYNIVDRMYVARIDGSGMDALAALGIVLPITLIIQAFANLVGLGGSPRAGIKLGEDNCKEANRIFNTAFFMLLVLGILIGMVTFLFSKQIVLLFGCPPSAVGFATAYLKIYSCGTLFCHAGTGVESVYTDTGIFIYCNECCFNRCSHQYCVGPNFYFTLRMGVRGSGLATIFSQFCSCICIICFSSLRKVCFTFSVKDMQISFARIANIVSLGFTPFIMTLTECAIQIVFNINLNRATGRK